MGEEVRGTRHARSTYIRPFLNSSSYHRKPWRSTPSLKRTWTSLFRAWKASKLRQPLCRLYNRNYLTSLTSYLTIVELVSVYVGRNISVHIQSTIRKIMDSYRMLWLVRVVCLVLRW